MRASLTLVKTHLMKFLSLVVVLLLCIFTAEAQLEYGGVGVGKHVIGISLGYSYGELEVGAKFTERTFAGPFSRPLNWNVEFNVPVTDLANGFQFNSEVGISQVYGKAPATSFGMLTGVYFTYSMLNIDPSWVACRASSGLKLAPGYYDVSGSAAPVVAWDFIQYTGVNTDKGNPETKVSNWSIGKDIDIGFRYDWTRTNFATAGIIDYNWQIAESNDEDVREFIEQQRIHIPLTARAHLAYQF